MFQRRAPNLLPAGTIMRRRLILILTIMSSLLRGWIALVSVAACLSVVWIAAHLLERISQS